MAEQRSAIVGTTSARPTQVTNDDYALKPVPTDRTVSGVRIAVVVIGIIIALPAFITGAEIGFALGFRTGILAIFLGGIVLTFIAAATGAVGAKARLNTAMLTKLTFGSLGGRMVSFILALTCLGWFGVTAELFGRGVHRILADFGWHSLPPTFYVVCGGVLMVTTTVFGFSALQRLSNITVPLLAILIAYTAYVTMQRGPLSALAGHGAGDSGLGDGVSAIVGGLSVAVTIFPDLSRFSRSTIDAGVAAVMTYGIAMPTILLLAMIPSIVTHQRDLMVIMAMLGLGVPALALLVVKAWATNAGNLYSASLSAANLLPVISQKWITVGAGCAGILLAVAGISERFIPFLVVLGVSIPPVAGIYVAEFLLLKATIFDAKEIDKLPAINYVAFACWAFGIAVALSARAGILTVTGIAACDSILVSAASYVILRRLRPAYRRISRLQN